MNVDISFISLKSNTVISAILLTFSVPRSCNLIILAGSPVILYTASSNDIKLFSRIICKNLGNVPKHLGCGL
ncbi:hypothetical protein SDC9_148544 [bioreactor metagenome]|uniref:Uncharacterized protein n=1 Tax=bioreactor metagenome TaxID=1076179 RepID=A0A645EH42_9ZZZZ